MLEMLIGPGKINPEKTRRHVGKSYRQRSGRGIKFPNRFETRTIVRNLNLAAAGPMAGQARCDELETARSEGLGEFHLDELGIVRLRLCETDRCIGVPIEQLSPIRIGVDEA